MKEIETFYTKSFYNSYDKQQRWIISEFNRTLLKFEAFTCFIVLYDCVMVPFKASFGDKYFDDNTKLVLQSIDYTIKFFFVIDVIIQFRKAYSHPDTGTEVRDPKKIAVRYLKFYFWIDSISAVPFDLISDNKLVQMLALIKVFRLFRLGKLVSFMQFDTKQRSRVRVVYMIISLLLMIHWVTCLMFYLVSDIYNNLSEEERNSKWVNNYWIPPIDVVVGKTEFY
jgi:hypothetical protein